MPRIQPKSRTPAELAKHHVILSQDDIKRARNSEAKATGFGRLPVANLAGYDPKKHFNDGGCGCDPIDPSLEV